jgi:hypothetical protein
VAHIWLLQSSCQTNKAASNFSSLETSAFSVDFWINLAEPIRVADHDAPKTQKDSDSDPVPKDLAKTVEFQSTDSNPWQSYFDSK